MEKLEYISGRGFPLQSAAFAGSVPYTKLPYQLRDRTVRAPHLRLSTGPLRRRGRMSPRLRLNSLQVSLISRVASAPRPCRCHSRASPIAARNAAEPLIVTGSALDRLGELRLGLGLVRGRPGEGQLRGHAIQVRLSPMVVAHAHSFEARPDGRRRVLQIADSDARFATVANIDGDAVPAAGRLMTRPEPAVSAPDPRRAYPLFGSDRHARLTENTGSQNGMPRSRENAIADRTSPSVVWSPRSARTAVFAFHAHINDGA